MSLASGEHHNDSLLQYYYIVGAGSADICLDLRVALRAHSSEIIAWLIFCNSNHHPVKGKTQRFNKINGAAILKPGVQQADIGKIKCFLLHLYYRRQGAAFN